MARHYKHRVYGDESVFCRTCECYGEIRLKVRKMCRYYSGVVTFGIVLCGVGVVWCGIVFVGLLL